MASTWQNLFGENEGFIPVPRYNPQSQQLLENLIKSQSQKVQQPLGQQPALNAQKQQALKNFETNTVPTIANRFLAGNTGNSSAFQGALGSAASDLELGLQQLQDQYGNQQLQNLMQLLSLQPQEYLYKPQSYGLLGEVAKNVPRALGAYATGGLSEGGNILSSLAQLLGGGENMPQQQGGPSKVGIPSTQGIGQLLQLLGMASQQAPVNPQSQLSQDNKPITVTPQQDIKSILQNLGTTDFNTLRNQNLLRGLKPLYNLGI